MVKSSIVRLPNGVTIEISSDFTSDQINAIITSVMNGEKFSNSKPIEMVKDYFRDANEIWEASKKEKMALFIRTYFSKNLWFGAKDVLEEQLNIARTIIFGETSQIGTYLKRLSEDGLLYRNRSLGKVKYQISEKLFDEYPDISMEEMQELMLNSL